MASSRATTRTRTLVAAAVLLGAAGCASGATAPGADETTEATEATEAPARSAPPTSSSSSSAPPATAGGSIVDYAYAFPASVPAGSSFEVTNDDDVTHTVTSPQGLFGEGVPAGGTATVTAPAEPGQYEVTCYFHSDMTGTLVVS